MIVKCLLVILIGLLVSACGQQEPIRIGFVGGLSDRNSDVGQAGQNGVILAIEQANRAGGIQGRKIELISRDDAQDRETSIRAARELAQAKVEAVIGPFTSGVAVAVVPTLAYHGILAISPTLTSMDFFGKDDNLVRINRSTRDNAIDYARVLYGRGQRRIAVAYDVRNRSFSESWLAEFRRAFTALGGRLAVEVPYESKADADFGGIVETMLVERPDGLFFISGALDVARLAQQARRLSPGLPLGASEWAATEQLVKLGGAMVEGLVIGKVFFTEIHRGRFVKMR